MSKLWSEFDWNQARAFLAAAETGSLSGAARALGLTQPTLSRQVAALEADLNITLFERVSGGLLLTQAGERLLIKMRNMGNAAEEFARVASGHDQTLEGRVSITAADLFATYILPLALRDLRKDAPKLQIEIIAANEISDLQRREADIAIRNVRPTQPDLIAKQLGKSKGCLYAARSFLDEHGPIETFDDLHAHPFIASDNIKETQGFLENLGIKIADDNFVYLSSQGVVQLEMLRLGLGLGLMADFIVPKIGDLVPVLRKETSVEFPIWLIAHRELATSARLRFVFDYLDRWIKQSGIVG